MFKKKERGKNQNTVINLNDSLSTELYKEAKAKKKKERFLKTRMWFSTMVSRKNPDKVKIPEDIGNSVCIENNMYITKNYFTKLYCNVILNDDTNVSFTEDLINYVKKRNDNVIIDPIIRTAPYSPNIYNITMENKVRFWKKYLDLAVKNDKNKALQERFAKLLFTHHVLKQGDKAVRAYISIFIRSDNINDLLSAEDTLQEYFGQYSIHYKPIKSYIYGEMEKNLFISGSTAFDLKEYEYNVLTTKSLADVLPYTQGTGIDHGILMGIDVINKNPRYSNFKSSSGAKNIYVIGKSGEFKTFTATHWLIDALFQGYSGFIRDVKGNEFEELVKAVGGISISMGVTSTKFPAFFKLNPFTEEDPNEYFNKRYQIAKQILIAMVDAKPEYESEVEVIISNFIDSLFIVKGIVKDNVSTWSRSSDLDWYTVYDMLHAYISPDIIKQFPNTANDIVSRCGMYISRKGSLSHFCREELDIDSILDTRLLLFSYALLREGENMNRVMYKVKNLCMSYVNAEYARYKYLKGEHTVAILEESQFDDPLAIAEYTKDVTLRRSQGRINVVLGNSVTSLDSKEYKAMLENFNIYAIGPLTESARKTMCEQYGLERHAETLKNIEKKAEYKYSFLYVDKNDKDSIDSILRIEVTDWMLSNKLLKVVKTDDSKESVL